jgi:adenosine deaminase
MPMHPLLVYLAHGVPVTINCDDPAIWGSVGVSYDYYQVYPFFPFEVAASSFLEDPYL